MSKKSTKHFNKLMYDIAVKQQRRKDDMTAFGVGILLPIWVLHDKYDWDKEKIETFVNQMWEINHLINKGELVASDIVSVLYEETGVRLKNGRVVTDTTELKIGGDISGMQ